MPRKVFKEAIKDVQKFTQSEQKIQTYRCKKLSKF